MRKIFVFFLAAMVLVLASCGKAARPVPYEGSGYPHSYPYNHDIEVKNNGF